MDREQAVKYLQFSGFSEEQIKAIEGAFSCPSAGIDCGDCPAYEKKSEWQQDHEILKAYSDGASAVLDKIRAEIDTARFVDKDTKHCRNANATGLEVALDIIDKYREPTGTEEG